MAYSSLLALESALVAGYLRSGLRLPGPVMQASIDAYLSMYHRLGARFLPRPQEWPPTVPAISHRTADLMRAQYDMPLTLFQHMLGPTMKYSMALWTQGAHTLEEAQAAMMADVCQKAGVQDGDDVLDVGCGFGSLAGHILRAYPRCRVWAITASRVQADYMKAQQQIPGSPLDTERFHPILGDFAAAAFPHRFHRVLCLEVFEHVGNLALALKQLGTFLRPGGTAFLHGIVHRQALQHMRTRTPEDNFIGRHVFPGARIWNETELARHSDDLRVERQWYLNGNNYARTHGTWLSNFLAARREIHAATGLSWRQLRLWELYLRTCVALFRSGKGEYYGNAQYLLLPQGRG